MIKFRGHHLICLHFFQGEGYSEKFVRNLKNLVQRANDGETILIWEGADDVCSACPSLQGNVCTHREGTDAEFKKLDSLALDFLGLTVGKKIFWSEVKSKVNTASREWFDAFCGDCEWKKICKEAQKKNVL